MANTAKTENGQAKDTARWTHAEQTHSQRCANARRQQTKKKLSNALTAWIMTATDTKTAQTLTAPRIYQDAHAMKAKKKHAAQTR